MNKFLKVINVLVLSLGLISVNAQAVVVWVQPHTLTKRITFTPNQ